MLKYAFLVILLLITVGNAQTTQQQQTDEKLIDLKISTTRNVYYLKEPIILNLNYQNISSQPVMGGFSSNTNSSYLEIYYRRGDQPFQKFISGKQMATTMPSKLSPNSSISGEEIMLFNAQTGSFIFNEDGDYQFKAIWEDDYNLPSKKYESNILSIRVITPSGEDNAIKLYSEETIARFIQGDNFQPLTAYQEGIDKMLKLAETYPQSIYTKFVRHSQMERLSRVVRSSGCLETEKRLYKIFDAQQIEFHEKRINQNSNPSEDTTVFAESQNKID